MFDQSQQFSPQEIFKIHKFLSAWANWIIIIPVAIAIILVVAGTSLYLINRKVKSEGIEIAQYIIFSYSCLFVILSPLIFLVLALTQAFHWVHGLLLFLFVALFLIPFFRSILATPVKVKKSSWFLISLAVIFYITALIISYYHISR